MDSLSGYCYGPVTVNSVTVRDDTLEIIVVDSALRKNRAIYTGCVYWQIDNNNVGERLIMVETKTAAGIASMYTNHCYEELKKITSNIDRTIERWQNEGFNFYLHHFDVANSDCIVVAKNLTYML